MKLMIFGLKNKDLHFFKLKAKGNKRSKNFVL